jgi:hypothetical protein
VTGFGQTHFSDSLSEHFFRILSAFERLTAASHPLSSHSVSFGIFTHMALHPPAPFGSGDPAKARVRQGGID